MDIIKEITSEQEMCDVAARVAPVLEAGDVVCLSGDLGAGKTVFARALIRARAQDQTLAVPSPTFTLCQHYEANGAAPLEIYHFDLYRLEDPGEIYEIGWEEALSEGAALVEWPQRLHDLIPENCLTIAFSIGAEKDGRRLVFSASPESLWKKKLEKAGLLHD